MAWKRPLFINVIILCTHFVARESESAPRRIFTHLDFAAHFLVDGLSREIPVGIFHLSTLAVVRRANTKYVLVLAVEYIVHTIHVDAQSLYYNVSHSRAPFTLISPKTWWKWLQEWILDYSVGLFQNSMSHVCRPWMCVRAIWNWFSAEWGKEREKCSAKTSVRNFPRIIPFYSCNNTHSVFKIRVMMMTNWRR